MNVRLKKKKILLIIAALILIAWSIFLVFIDLEALAQEIGLHNVYFILFFVAATAGTSFLTSAAFYAVYLSYISTGIDPIILGVIAGVGTTLGDAVYFYFSSKAGDLINADENKVYKKVHGFIFRLPRWGVYLFTYLYASFAPIPNDILIITLGVLKFKFRYIMPLILLGNITLLTLIAYGINFTLF